MKDHVAGLVFPHFQLDLLESCFTSLLPYNSTCVHAIVSWPWFVFSGRITARSISNEFVKPIRTQSCDQRDIVMSVGRSKKEITALLENPVDLTQKLVGFGNVFQNPVA